MFSPSPTFLRRAVAALFCLAGLELARADVWTFEQGGVRVEIDATRSGQLVRWTADSKTLLASPEAGGGPLTLTEASGARWSFAADSFSEFSDGDARGVKIVGRLAPEAGGAGAVGTEISYLLREGGRRIELAITHAGAPDRVIRDYSWTLPLGLRPRKRVFYLSDYGLEWETRYFYQLVVEPRSGTDVTAWGLMNEPDRNIWRHFALDQLGRDAYRLWKAAEDGNAPVTMHEGRSPAPAVQVFDEAGGITVEYPRLREAAPKSLRVDAAGGGKIEVAFWPSCVAPAPAAKTGAFGRHEIVLTAHASERAALDGQRALAERYAADFSPRPDPAAVLREETWITGAPLAAAQTVTGGWPIAAGELRDAGAVRVKAAGAPVAVQARPLAFWPDGSVKWAQLTFAVDAARAVADCPPPRVSLRSGKFVPVEISTAGAPAAPVASLSVSRGADGVVRVVNGDLRAEFGPGSGWWRSAEWRGVAVIDGRRQARLAYADYVNDPAKVFPFDHRAEGGVRDAGALKVDALTVEESGPLRAVLRLEGLTDNREPTRVVLRLEFVAGRPEIKITHTAVFRFKDPRRTFLTGLGLELPLATAATEGGSGVVQLAQPTIRLRRLLTDGEERPAAETPSGWLRAGGSRAGVTAIIRNFRQQAPKAISADYRDGLLRLELWPRDHAPMDVRRYSDTLHFAQLESGVIPAAGKWIDSYYAEDSFFGVARTHELALVFDSGVEPAREPARGEAVAADLQSPPLLYAGWERYDATRTTAFASGSAANWPRAWRAWSTLTRFFLWHRELHGWEGFWTYGDFQHRYQGGFGWIVPPEVLRRMPKEGLMAVRQMDNRAANDWCYDIGAYGWTNTEGLPNLFLQHEYLRHGERAVYFAAEQMARHSRDVIVRQEGRWLGRGTRHGVQPWSDGNHEERQTAATEYRLHYFLSGDGRTRDVIENLYQNVYTKGTVGRHASHSGRLPGLLFHWELTGDRAEGERLRRYVGQFVSDQGVYVSPSVRFPDATKAGEPSQLNDGGQFFQTFGGMHTLVEYHALTGDAALAAALIKMADATIARPIIENGSLGQGEYAWGPVAFAALHAADPASYRAFLARYLEADGWRSAYQPVSMNPAHWSGATGFMAKTVPLGFFWANWAPYVAAALPAGEVWTPKIAAEFDAYEQRGRSSKAGRSSWQSQFDGIPEIEAYLAPQQPWREP